MKVDPLLSSIHSVRIYSSRTLEFRVENIVPFSEKHFIGSSLTMSTQLSIKCVCAVGGFRSKHRPWAPTWPPTSLARNKWIWYHMFVFLLEKKMLVRRNLKVFYIMLHYNRYNLQFFACLHFRNSNCDGHGLAFIEQPSLHHYHNEKEKKTEN